MEKVNVLGVIGDHFATLRSERTGRTSPTDVFLFYIVPIGLGLVSWRTHITLRSAEALLAVYGVLSALLLQLMVRTVEWAQGRNEPPEYILDRVAEARRERRVRLLAEVHENIAYAFFVALIATAVAAGIETLRDSAQPVSDAWTAVLVGIGAHLVLTLLMVLRRIYILGKDAIPRPTSQEPRTS